MAALWVAVLPLKRGLGSPVGLVEVSDFLSPRLPKRGLASGVVG